MSWKLPLPQTISRGRDLRPDGASTDAWMCNHIETTHINVCSKCGSLTLTTGHASKYIATCRLTASPGQQGGKRLKSGKFPIWLALEASFACAQPLTCFNTLPKCCLNSSTNTSSVISWINKEHLPSHLRAQISACPSAFAGVFQAENMGYVKDPRATARGGQINKTKSQKEQQREAMVHLRPPSPVH